MKVISIALTLCGMAGLALAQDASQWEVSGGYQLTRVDLASLPARVNLLTQSAQIPSLNVPSKLNSIGFDASLQENLNRWFGGVFDFSAAYPSLTRNVTPQALAILPGASVLPTLTNASYTGIAKGQLYNFLFGPQFTLRRSSRIQPFVRVLVGGSHGRTDANVVYNGVKLYQTLANDTSVAFGGGGGVDIKVTDRVYFRAAADLIRTSLFNDTEENVRATAAISYRFSVR